MKIVGLDVGSASVVACCLEALPLPLKPFFAAHKSAIVEFPATRSGIAALLAVKPDIAILEPTGMHYAEFWQRALTVEGVEVRYVGHVQVRAYRKLHRLPNKNDRADALALAAYGWQYIDNPEFFLRFVPKSALHLRRCVMQLAHLNRITTPIINCTRQYLAHEFPEVAKMRSLRKVRDDLPPLWGWLSGDRASPYYDRLWKKSVAHEYGLEISEFTIHQSKRICDLERHQDRIEQEILTLLQKSDFAIYCRVFDSFGFGVRSRAVLLSHIYPFEDFLNQDNQPVIEWGESKSGRATKRDRSLRAFKLRIGMGLVEDSSGQSTNWVPGGSSLCRQALWQWCLCQVEPRRGRHTDTVRLLGEYLDELKASQLPGKLAQLRTCAKAATLLYRRLLQAFSQKELE
ncbi:hypothetical protein Glo7428_3769 [Gloeocapsa sp. PCC 7428]|uniref:IS110 family transposase n=1 Tax=Gloeocapsa sp. PCC 7428 TaxID=1173026 RepID=UPI0002A5BC28|nr:transposase [Gloeocapsa sp. PCC 7428]AFZ32229.1 hypothetical protein Glo7428_3769 [Gloeocapsa sp. PCC 7428]